MTIEELKIEADKLGYRLYKKQEYIKTSKCPKCHVKPKEWYSTKAGNRGPFYRCPMCDLSAPVASKNILARANWNEMVENIKEGDVETKDEH